MIKRIQARSQSPKTGLVPIKPQINRISSTTSQAVPRTFKLWNNSKTFDCPWGVPCAFVQEEGDVHLADNTLTIPS